MSQFVHVAALRRWANCYAFPTKVYFRAAFWKCIDDTVTAILLTRKDTRPRNVNNEQYLTIANVKSVFRGIDTLSRSHAKSEHDLHIGVKLNLRKLLHTTRIVIKTKQLVIRERRKRKIMAVLGEMLRIILQNSIIYVIDAAVKKQRPQQHAVFIEKMWI
jgi:hypothetical protein